MERRKMKGLFDVVMVVGFELGAKKWKIICVLDGEKGTVVVIFGEEKDEGAEVYLSPRLCKKVYGGDGGFYYARSPAELPKLKEGNIGGAKLAPEKNVFALPAGDIHCQCPIFTHSDGRTYVWKALSPQVLEASFKVSPDVEQLFRAKRMDEEIFFPRPK
ncbi:hypothetical protein DKX38_015925 [Salix brachista]|uniref:Uncharacterized protein n=1 Tax=Salix brachista TaxID=2182728 RepID=A0A5N5L6T1_9ROSI|nr:hypothetical protein DKX38_015925 [Salix brachista]